MVSPKVSWTASVGENDGYLTPAVTDNAVYAAGGSSLYRLDRHTGDKVWEAEAGSRIVAGVGTDGMHQAVVTDRGEVEVYDAEGKFIWRATLSAETDVPPLVGQGLVVVKTSDTRITAFDIVTGERRWHYQGQAPALTLQAFNQMAWSPAGILAGQANGRLLALGLNGKPVFDAVIGQAAGITEVERLIDVVGRPWVDNQLMCAAAFQGNLVCMSSTNGQLVWNAKVSSSGMRRSTASPVRSPTPAWSTSSTTRATSTPTTASTVAKPGSTATSSTARSPLRSASVPRWPLPTMRATSR